MDTKLYLLVVTLSIQKQSILLEKTQLAFNCTTNWNKYQSKVSAQPRNQYFEYLNNHLLLNRLFVLSFENGTGIVHNETGLIHTRF